MAEAHEFVLNLYKLSERFPRHEQYCLIPQARRAAISIPANIAEGFKKRGIPDKNRFFNISQGSVEECRYYLILAEDLGHGQCSRLEPLLEDVSRLLIAYAQAVATNNSASPLSRRKSSDSDAPTSRHATKEFRRRRKGRSSLINRQSGNEADRKRGFSSAKKSQISTAKRPKARSPRTRQKLDESHPPRTS